MYIDVEFLLYYVREDHQLDFDNLGFVFLSFKIIEPNWPLNKKAKYISNTMPNNSED